MPCACCNSGVLHSVHVLKTLQLSKVFVLVGETQPGVVFNPGLVLISFEQLESLLYREERALADFFLFFCLSPKGKHRFPSVHRG